MIHGCLMAKKDTGRGVLPEPPAQAPPDLATQLEELRVEVWRQEKFERTHPFACRVIRESARRGAQRSG